MRILALLFTLAVISPLCAARADPGERMDAVSREEMTEQRFMGAVLVARGETILLNKGYGHANLEWMIENTPRTKFRLASLTKQFTAAAILQLAEKKKLKLDDPISTWISDSPPSWSKITIHHLLTHRSGIFDYTRDSANAETAFQKLTPQQTMKLFRDKPLDFAPDEKMSYSNSGYILLGLIIEKASGQSYVSFLKDNIFTPLAMLDTGYDDHDVILPNRASGYTARREGFSNARYIAMTGPYAAGGLYSTTEDLLKWQEALFDGKVVTRESLTMMTTPTPDSNFGMGLSISERWGQKRIAHSGGIDGFSTQLTYYPDEGLTIIVLGNVQSMAPVLLADKLEAMLHGQPIALRSERKIIKMNPKTLRNYVGKYRLSDDFFIDVSLKAGELVTGTGQDAIILLPVSETTFFADDLIGDMEFVRDEKGQVDHLVMKQPDGQNVVAKRIAPAGRVKRPVRDAN